MNVSKITKIFVSTQWSSSASVLYKQDCAKRRLSQIIASLLIITVLLGCSNQAPASPTNAPAPAAQPSEAVTGEEGVPQPEVTTDADTVQILVEDAITTLEPYRMVNVHPEGSIASHLWDTLTLLNDDLQIEPHLAESWRLVNNLTWEFNLRQDVTFHNGEPFNAESVRFSIERSRSMAGSLETFATDVNFEEVEIVDEYTLRLSTSRPVANLPFHLAFVEMLPPVYYAETPPDQLAAAPVGSGPYRLSQWVSSEEVVLERVSDYWKGASLLPRIVFNVIPSIEDRLAVLSENPYSLATDLSALRRDEWNVSNSRLEVIESTQRLFVGIRIDDEGPLSDKRVRQALNYGVDVNQIVEDQLKGYEERYGSWVNPPWNNTDLVPWQYDADQARDLLAQAGYAEGITATLYVPIGTYRQGVAVSEAIVQQLDEIGVTVEVESVDWEALVRQLLSGDVPPLVLLGLNSRGDGLEDAKNLSDTFAFNTTGWRNATFETLIEQAQSAFSDSSRSRLLHEAQAIAYDEAPWIWLWRQYQFYGVGENLDWTPRRDGLVNMYTAPVESSQ